MIPIPLPFVQNVIDRRRLPAVGLAFFLFASVVRTPQELDEESEGSQARRRAARIAAATGRRGSRRATRAALQRGCRAGAADSWLAAPARRWRLRRRTHGFELGEGGRARRAAPAGPGVVDRVREHPYVRLALNGSFSALWAGQLISLFGDRIHQLAIA